MKILWLTNIPSPYRVDFFNLLGEQAELTVLFEKEYASDRNKAWKKEKFKNFNGVILPGMNTGTDNAFCPSVVKWLKKRVYDFIVVANYSTPSGMFAIQVLKIKNIPFLLEVDGGFAKGGRGFKEQLKKSLIGAASYWLSSGEKTSEYLIYYGARKDRIFWYPFTSVNHYHIINGVNSIIEKLQLRKDLKITCDKIAVAVGQFIHRKGFDNLINAWTNVDPRYNLLIIGGGELEAEYADMIKRLSLKNVKLIGFKPRDEVFRYYKAADLFILPTREDIWGLVVNEAMACGLPVITTEKCIAGMELVAENQNGFIVPADDIASLADKINYVLSNEEVQRKMSGNSLSVISKYTLENMAETHIKVFESIGGVK